MTKVAMEDLSSIYVADKLENRAVDKVYVAE
jgi:hypothetical protein